MGTSIDVTERKPAEEEGRESESHFKTVVDNSAKAGLDSETRPRLILDKTPALIFSSRPDGFIDFFNQRSLEFLGLPLEEISGWGWTKLIHSDDIEGLLAKWRRALQVGEPFVAESRMRRADGAYRWMLHRCVSLRDEQGNIARWFGSSIDIDDQKSAEAALRQTTDELRRSEFYLSEGQRLAHIGSWSFTPDGTREYWSAEWFDILGLDPARGVPPIPDYLNIVHPDDRAFVKGEIERMIEKGEGCDAKYRITHPQRGVRWIRGVGMPVFENGVLTRFAGTSMDITEEETLTQELRRSEGYLAEAQRLSHTGSFGWVVSTGEIFWSEETFRIFEYDSFIRPTVELVIERVHSDDKAFVRQVIDRVTQEGKDFDVEYRLLMPDKRIKYLHVIAHRLGDDSGNIELIGAVRDVTAAKIAQRKLKEDEAELRQLINFVPEHVLVMDANGIRLYDNQAMRDYFGTSLEGIQAKDFYTRFIHPDDVASGILEERERSVSRGALWEGELRFRRKDGAYRWFLIRCNPLCDDDGNVIRRYATATDIDDRKRAEERVKKENVALREEIDKASMFEEIVGSSAALKDVLARVSKVAPTDATVLLTGETGTGKELIARAIHKRSKRSAKAFVTVNCAAIPSTLIGSELFGHEKGAFTGALQRRLGRFELADGGTLFLDEIGELLMDTQSALLRVLQEGEFERVGGTHTIRADVRVIAATNRDLKAAMMNGTFRSDLFYRLQVFPIEIRPLRERKEDIPLLVEYFIDRYANKVGKKIKGVNRKSLDLLRSYFWPGNIRELQNLIERAVIVSEGDVLWIDESWLSTEAATAEPITGRISKLAPDQEKKIIEAALAETRGRVSGPSGAATKLGVPSTTLDSRIRSLKINKHRFKSLD
ncbi:MAG TPA: sigma 54-interacting transcriptional regulator [Terriglobales bacterium]|nr:sigma 54-interacting transcriptional regulator [Terriglobales bacterium]